MPKSVPTPAAQPTMVLVGKRSAFSRRAMGLVGAMLLGVTTLTPDTAMAQSYRNLLDKPSVSATQYGTTEALRATRGRLAEVVMVQPVEIKDDRRAGFGAVFGALLGAVAADQIDNSDARRVARVALSGAGAMAGQRIQRGVSGTDGVLISVLDPKHPREIINVPQADDQNIQPGDFVMLVGNGSKIRVVALDPQVNARLRMAAGRAATAPSEPTPRRGYSPR